MNLLWPILFWALVLLAIIVAGVAFAIAIVRRRSDRGDGVRVAHVDRLRRLPAFKRAVRLQKVFIASAAVAIGLGVVFTSMLSARPAKSDITYPEQFRRDIMLCLDVSSSMYEYLPGILESFSEYVEQLRGERVGLQVWNATSMQIFPLTDDYEFVRDQLDSISEDVRNFDFSWSDGTIVSRTVDGSSLVGDGVATCAFAFDRDQQDERSRSVLVATDNEVSGVELVTLDEAAAIATERGVTLYGIGVADMFGAGANLQAFADAVESTGGSFSDVDDPDAVSAVVERIQAETSAATGSQPIISVRDLPGSLGWWTFAGFSVLMLVVWRLHR